MLRTQSAFPYKLPLLWQEEYVPVGLRSSIPRRSVKRQILRVAGCLSALYTRGALQISSIKTGAVQREKPL